MRRFLKVFWQYRNILNIIIQCKLCKRALYSAIEGILWNYVNFNAYIPTFVINLSIYNSYFGKYFLFDFYYAWVCSFFSWAILKLCSWDQNHNPARFIFEQLNEILNYRYSHHNKFDIYTSLPASQQCYQAGKVISMMSNHNFRKISRNLNAKYPKTMSHTLNITVKQGECNRYVICFSAHWFFFRFQFFTHTCKKWWGFKHNTCFNSCTCFRHKNCSI